MFYWYHANERRRVKNSKNSIAIGLDGLVIIMFKQIESEAANYLAKTFNLCTETFQIELVWKKGKIVPKSKLGKYLHSRDANSFNPYEHEFSSNFRTTKALEDLDICLEYKYMAYPI